MVRIIYAFNVAKWKRPLLKKYFKKDVIKYISLSEELRTSNKVRVNKLLLKRTVFLVWGMKEPYDLIPFAEQWEIPIWRVEDGFVRSIGLGSDKCLPYSLCIDKTGIYFNSKTPSDLELLILSNKDFIKKSDINKAKTLIERIKSSGISKYNNGRLAYELSSYSNRSKIIVIGQVEDDQSIIFGTKTPLTNVDMIKTAIEENPDADIYFKPHPDYIKSSRKIISDYSEFDDVYMIPSEVPLNSIFSQVDQVYTISSLGGFEALLHGKKVTVLGCPFYSGWGLTDDRYTVERRNVSVDIETLFAAAYMIYPRYLNPQTGQRMSLESVLDEFDKSLLIEQKYRNYRKEHLYNAKTKTDINISYLDKYDEIVVIADNVEVLSSNLIKKKNVTIAFITEALVRECDGITPPNVKVFSLPRYLNVAYSNFEKETCNFNKVLKSGLSELLHTLKFPINKNIITTFALDFEQAIYHESAKYLTIRELALTNTPLILSLNNEKNIERFHPMIQSVYQKCDSHSDLYFLSSERKQGIFDFKQENLSSQPINELKSQMDSLYYSVLREVEKDSTPIDQRPFVTVVGNINNRNYTYSKIALDSLRKLDKKYRVLYVPVVEGDATLEDNKFILNTDGLYNIKVASFKSSIDFDYQPFSDALLHSMKETLPVDFLSFISNNVSRFFSSFSSNLYKYLYFRGRLEMSSGFLTCLENSFISRCISDIHLENNKKSVSLQSWRIAESPRNTIPMVGKVGVIDSYQAELFSKLGVDRDKIELVGSVNIFEKIDQIESIQSSEDDFLLILQHSMHQESEKTIEILARYFSENKSKKLYIKPHPHQDFATMEVLDKVRSENIIVLSKSSDTYQYISKSKYIISMFSSVVFESSLAGKNTIVINLGSIHDSVNYAKMGLALEVTDYNSFSSLANRLNIEGQDPFEAVEKTRTKFLMENPQFKHRDALEKFIDSIGY